MARVSIYVSDELKARMAETGDALNWSDIARPAFETAIAAFNHRKGQNMQTAIERLRASKAAHYERLEGDAKAAGRDWASNRASYADLVTLSTLDVGLSLDSVWPALKSAIDPGDDLSNDEAAQTLFGDDEPRSDQWLEAFVEGAQEFYGEIEDQI